MEAKQLGQYTLQEYIELEQSTGEKYQYFDGEVFAMAGGTLIHGMLCSKVAALLDQSLNGKNCTALNSEVKVFLQERNAYVYPDASVVCGKLETSEEVAGAISNPVVIVEVFSESSERDDRGKKFHLYRRLPALQNYILISQNKALVEVWYRPAGADLWRVDVYEGMDEKILIQSLELELSVAKLYDSVKEMIE